jgi:hypothetical protein
MYNMKSLPTEVSKYFSKIGRKGGSISRRALSSETARDMVRVREARRAFREFHAECFWYMPRDMNVSKEDIPEIVRGLRQNGGRQGFLLADKLCR